MIQIAANLSSVVTLGVISFDDLQVGRQDPELAAALAEAERRVRTRPPAERSAVRTMYRRAGIDPTKTRPSSEALLRRVMRGQPLPRINALVDVCNWCSLELQVPYGVYDRDQIRGAIGLRFGQADEAYAGIRKDVVHLAGLMTLADEAGPFGNPTSDSARTLVSAATVRGLVVLFAPRELGRAWLEPAIELTSTRVAQFAAGREVARATVIAAPRSAA